MKNDIPRNVISCLMLLIVILMSGSVVGQVLTLPLDERPEWVRKEGVVMAGSWEPLLFRARRDGAVDYQPTPEEIAAYNYEHSPEFVAKLKEIGVNFIMMHCYKGAGLIAERQSMQDAVEFARLCRENNIRVGVYNYSGALIWDVFRYERPDAIDWLLLDSDGRFLPYGGQIFRCRWNRNHPEAQDFYRKIIKFAVDEIQADLLHWDNYERGYPQFDRNSILRFRDYLLKTFTPDELKDMGIKDVAVVTPPVKQDINDMLTKAWLEFSTQSLADSYYDMSRYARSLRKDILVEGNFMGVHSRIEAPVDHGRLLCGGEAYWDENGQPGYENGKLNTRIRNFKVSRLMNNMNFNYMNTKLSMAESMAFNLDCLGCITFFEGGKLNIIDYYHPGSTFDRATLPFVQFFHNRRDILSYADVIADIAVLRSFPSQSFADPKYGDMTTVVEDLLIRHRQCFQIIYDQHLQDLSRYKVLVLAGCAAMSDEQLNQIKHYIDNGGKVVIVSDVAILDEWARPRKTSPLANLPSSQAVYASDVSEVIGGVNILCQDELSLKVACEYPIVKDSKQAENTSDSVGLCVELTAKENKRFVHLVNYRPDQAAEKIVVESKIPKGKKCKSVKIISPEHEEEIVLQFDQKNNTVDFTVPKVQVYEIAEICFE